MQRGRLGLLFLVAIFLSACRVILETPVPPPTETVMPLEAVRPTDTVTLPPSPTPISSPTPSPTPTETPTTPPDSAYSVPFAASLLATPTAEGMAMSLLSTPTAAPLTLMVQSSSPAFIPAFRYASLGCNWMGVAGQVFDASGKPLTGLVVGASGNVAGQSVNAVGITGSATAYGPAGYEIKLADRVAPAIFWLQVFNLQGVPLSEAQMFQMGGDCTKNLAIVNFVAANYLGNRLYLPMVGR